MKLRPISAAILFALAGLSLAVQADDVRRPYVVQLTDKPIASYDGGVSGLAATQPRPGQRARHGLDAVADARRRYVDLRRR